MLSCLKQRCKYWCCVLGAAYCLEASRCLATDMSHLCCSKGAIQVVAEELRHPSGHHPLKHLKPDKLSDHLFQMGEPPAG